MKSSLFVAVVLFMMAQTYGVLVCKECFSQICSSNPSNQIRGQDRWGSGAFGVSRGRRTHKGIDIVCSAGSNVYTPIPAKVLRRSNPYRYSRADYNTGIYLQGTEKWAVSNLPVRCSAGGYSIKIFYVGKRVRDGAILAEGTIIGEMKNRATRSRGMTNHVHVQLYKNGKVVDPTPYACD